tara:strand:- start:1768 stop:1980 length:213 start_codon:yes stop_codon:yes gene_type:complete
VEKPQGAVDDPQFDGIRLMGVLFGFLATASSRIVGIGFALAVWLISRPGGWAVLVVLTLLALRVFPGNQV